MAGKLNRRLNKGLKKTGDRFVKAIGTIKNSKPKRNNKGRRRGK